MIIFSRIIIFVTACALAVLFLTSPEETTFRYASGVMSILLFFVFVQSLLALHRRNHLISEARNEELSLSEARIRDFAESAADRFWETDENYRYTYVSESFEGSDYLATKAMIGRTRWEVSAGADLDGFWRDYIVFMDRHEAFRNLEHTRVGPDGKVFYFRTSGKPLFDQAGKFQGYRGTTVDITDAVEAKKIAQETNDRLVNAMEAMSEGVVFWDADDRIFACNDYYREIYHFIADILKPGVSFSETLEARIKIHELDMRGLSKEEWFARVKNDRIKQQFVIQEVQIDGKMYLVRRQNNDDGTAITFMTEVTGIKQTEAELKQVRDELEERVEERTRELQIQMAQLDLAHKELAKSEAQLSQIFDKSPVGVCIVNFVDGKIVFANPRLVELLNYKSVDELMGMATSEFWADKGDRKIFLKNFQKLGHVPFTKTMIKSSRREPFWVLESWDQYGELEKNQILVWIQDIDDLKAAQSELQRAKERSDLHWAEAEAANRTKSEFLANMSHELRTPLNAIIGFSDALNHKIFGEMPDERQADAVRHIKESGEHLLNVISDILDVSAIETGAMEITESNIEIPLVITAAIRMVEQRARANDIEIINKIGTRQSKFYADDRRIKQILVNLLSNAVKFTPAGGSITLEASVQSDGRLLISVADTGIGMDAAEIETALTRFGQVGRELRSDQEGTGLGLPLTRDLIELHGGEMEIMSSPNKGTTVRALFPSERVVA